MGLFNNIFDGISNSVEDFFSGNDSTSTYVSAGKDILGIGAAIGAGSGGKNMTNAGEGNVLRSLRIGSALDIGTANPLSRLENKSPIHTRDEFQQTESVNPFVLENEWNNRLQRYSEVTRMTGVSETGR